MSDPIQRPFTDGERQIGVEWSPEEDEMLLRGVAASMTFAQIAAEISAERKPRTETACKRRFEHLRDAARRPQ